VKEEEGLEGDKQEVRGGFGNLFSEGAASRKVQLPLWIRGCEIRRTLRRMLIRHDVTHYYYPSGSLIVYLPSPTTIIATDSTD